VTLVAVNLRKLVAKSLQKLNKLVLSLGNAASTVDLAGLAVPHVIDTRALTAHKVHFRRTRLKFSTLNALLYRCIDVSRLFKGADQV
jgi:hypothetical protein